MSEQTAGLVLWGLVTWPVWSPTLNWFRFQKHRQQRVTAASEASATRSTSAAETQQVLARAKQVIQESKPKWEQDVPFDECFQEDDL